MVLINRVCFRCGKNLPLTPEFFQYRNKTKGIFQGVCKDCNNARGRELYAKNPEKFREKQKDYYAAHADQIKEHSRKYSKEQREKYPLIVKEKKKRYRDAHKDEINQKAREYYLENHDEFRKRQNEYRNKNRDSINKSKRISERYRRKTDPVYKLKGNIRNAINDSFGRRQHMKNQLAEDVTGMKTADLCIYLMNTFKKIYGYEWDGEESVHIDHIVPLATANTEEEIIKLCHWSNLQLIKAEDNLKKGKNENYLIKGD